MAVKKKKASKHRLGRLLLALVGILIVLGAVLVFLYRDKLSPQALAPPKKDAAVSETEAYTYENGSNQIFDLMGDKLLIASGSGLQILDGNGVTIARDIFSMTNPAVCAGEKSAAFYDVGGSALRVFSDGKTTNLDSNQPIISVSMNPAGYLALTTEETGYKGGVTVYNNKLQPVYKWLSGSGYTLDAAVSPDCKSLAVLCLDKNGSTIHFFNLDSEKEQAAPTLPKELAFKLHYGDNGRLCVLSETALHFFNSNGEENPPFSFKGSYLSDFDLGDEFCTIALSKLITGSEIQLNSFSCDGRALGTVSLKDKPISLSSNKQKLLVFGALDAKLYTRELRPISESEIVPGFKHALLRHDGNALLLASSYCEKFVLK
ncbi:MAG: DUF5711 family protein [Oscillospiraceae bacterium]